MVCTMKKSVSILLVGKSGAGKSEFINSFAAHRDQIQASGEGQTTRTIVEYHFSINEPSPKVTVEYLSEDEFVEKQLAKEPEVPKEKYDESICEQILVTEGFFNYKEFDFVDDANSKKIETLWTGILHTLNKEETALTNDYSKEQLSAVADYLKSQFAEGLTLKIADKKVYKLNDLVELYLKAVYKVCKTAAGSFPKEFDLNTITPELTEQLKYFLKIHDQKSVTGLLKKVVIKDRVLSQFEPMLNLLQVQTVKFIDTYGLDHSEQPDTNGLTDRYQTLFNEYPELDSVFFIRALNTDSPSDLSTAIPAIYDANPSAVPYLVCTKIDENQAIQILANKTEIDLLALNSQYHFKPVSHITGSKNEKDLKRILYKAKIPETLIDSRYDVLVKNIISYCSKNVAEYQENNAYQIKKLFTSIVNKEHLGTANIDTEKLRHHIPTAEAQITELMKEMFVKASKDWDPLKKSTRTLWKNKEYLEYGLLGYNGTYYDRWYNRFLTGYAQSFSKMSENQVQKLFNVTPGSNEAIALLEILNKFAYSFIKFTTDYKLNTGENMTDFMKEVVSKNPMFVDGEFMRDTNLQVNEWLTQVYNFEGYFDSVQMNMHILFVDAFLDSFIKECKMHNARVAARSAHI